MNRSAPSAGYDFGNKRQYRRDIWCEAAEFCAHKKNDAHVLLMPSSEGDEIEVAEQYGFKRRNMHVVDKNPAILAHLTRRYPGINTSGYGCDVMEALSKIAERGIKLSVANFDLCSHVVGAEPLLEEVRKVRRDAFVDHCLIFATVMRGRESLGGKGSFQYVAQNESCVSWFESLAGLSVVPNQLNKLCSVEDRLRAGMMISALINAHERFFVLPKAPKIYKSERVTMMWVGVVFLGQATSTPLTETCRCRHCVRWLVAAAAKNGYEFLNTKNKVQTFWRKFDARRQYERAQHAQD